MRIVEYAKEASRNTSVPRLLVGMLVTGLCSLGIHSLMLDVLGVPGPHAKIDAPLVTFLGRDVPSALALIYVAILGSEALAKLSPVNRSLALFVLGAMATESLFRAPYMNAYCNQSYALGALQAAPRLGVILSMAILIVATERLSRGVWSNLGRATIIAAVGTFFVLPLLNASIDPTVQALSQSLPPSGLCQMPYGWDVNIRANLSFAEPVIASLCILLVVCGRLSSRPWVRVVQFTLLVLCLRRQLVASFIYMAYSGKPALAALASMGQFTLEGILLGVLTALTWMWARQAGRRERTVAGTAGTV